jgi:hypothetical protein
MVHETLAWIFSYITGGLAIIALAWGIFRAWKRNEQRGDVAMLQGQINVLSTSFSDHKKYIDEKMEEMQSLAETSERRHTTVIEKMQAMYDNTYKQVTAQTAVCREIQARRDGLRKVEALRVEARHDWEGRIETAIKKLEENDELLRSDVQEIKLKLTKSARR